jgi:hypothetical protein
LLAEWQTQLSQLLVRPVDSAEETTMSLTALQGIDASRLALYRELMHNTVRDTLESIYPFTVQLLKHGSPSHADEYKEGLESWASLAECFRRSCPNLSPKLTGAVENFPRFLAGEAVWMSIYPFLSELADYEWLEMQVLNMPDAPTIVNTPSETPVPSDFENFYPVWNQARLLQRFEFPIPEIINALQALTDEEHSLDHLSDAPQPTDMLFYRDPETLQVRFFVLNELTRSLIELSAEQPTLSYAALLQELQSRMPALQALPSEIIMEQAAKLFQNCLSLGLLFGSHPISTS